MLPKETVEFLLATGRAQNKIEISPTGEAFFIRPDGNPVGLAGFYPLTRIKEKVVLTDGNSFIDYFKRFANIDSTVFAHLGEYTAHFTAVLDYHEASEDANGTPRPRHGSHVATFQTIDTPDWKAWKDANRKRFSQLDFAVWLEDNLHLFVTPKEDPAALSGAGLLELVKTLHGHQSANFSESIRLDNGQHSVAYEEQVNVQGAMRSDKIVVPAFVYGGFKLFEGTAPYLVKARLKTRIENRKLILFFETVAMENMVRDCLNLVVAQIEAGIERRVLMGELAE